MVMRFSVAIPAYNSEETIEATLRSVFSQTETPAEVLVLDDGSTDRTPAILDRYTPRVTVLRQPNEGAGSARNRLCRQVHGDVVAFLDSDDIWHRRYLEVQHRLIREHPGAAAYFTGHVTFGGNGEYVWKIDPLDAPANTWVLPPALFLREYNAAPGSYY